MKIGVEQISGGIGLIGKIGDFQQVIRSPYLRNQAFY